MVKLDKTEILAFGIMVLGIGAMGGKMLTDRDYVALRVTMINEVQSNIVDMNEDVKNNVIDSTAASYYLHNWGIVEEQLTYTPDEYTEWYEQNNRNNTRSSSYRLDSVCSMGNSADNYKLNTNEDG